MTSRLCIDPKDHAAWSAFVRKLVQDRATEILRDHEDDRKEANLLFETVLCAMWPLDVFERMRGAKR